MNDAQRNTGIMLVAGHVRPLRAVASSDGMTADFFLFDVTFLGSGAMRIINDARGSTGWCTDVTSKPPGTIEWE